MTRYLLTTLLVAMCTLGNAQTNSYSFAKFVAPNGIEVENVSPSYYGEYILDDYTLIINEKGIFSKNTLYLSISKETIRKNDKYSVRGNYLFGIKENDSIFCVLDGDQYFYGLREEVQLIGDSTSNKLIDDGDCYYINFYEDGIWMPARLEFKNGKLLIAHFDYPSDTEVFNHIELRTQTLNEGLNEIKLWPTSEEWNAIDLSIIFPEVKEYIRL